MPWIVVLPEETSPIILNPTTVKLSAVLALNTTDESFSSENIFQSVMFKRIENLPELIEKPSFILPFLLPPTEVSFSELLVL